jgi:hypothetical protein
MHGANVEIIWLISILAILLDFEKSRDLHEIYKAWKGQEGKI